jgi:hypothetical protein
MLLLVVTSLHLTSTVNTTTYMHSPVVGDMSIEILLSCTCSLQDAPAGVSQLPHNVLVDILQRLDTQQQGISAAVCLDFSTAAAEALVDVHISNLSTSAALAMKHWLSHEHGQQVTRLLLSARSSTGCSSWHSSASSRPLLQLHNLLCPKLRQLGLLGFDLGLDSRQHQSALVPLWPHLTKISLRRCCILQQSTKASAYAAATDPTAADAGLMPLLCTSGLRCLKLSEVSTAGDGTAGSSTPAQAASLPAGLLPQLQHLTQLVLSSVSIPDSAIQQLSCLTNLQQLKLKSVLRGNQVATAIAAVTAAGLHTLTALVISDRAGLCGSDGILSSSNTPGLAFMTQLKQLKLQGCSRGLEPLLLAWLTQLTSFDVTDTAVLGGPDGWEALLDALMQLQQLRRLRLTYGYEFRQWMLPAALQQQVVTAPAHKFAALTVSSQLQSLVLTSSACGLPDGVWQHVFAAGRVLPQLRQLCLVHCVPENSPASYCSYRRQLMGPSDMQHMAQTCPSLQDLTLLGVVAATAAAAGALSDCGSAFEPLTQLRSTLTSLHVDGVSSSSSGIVAVAQLTNLEKLVLGEPSCVGDAGLEQLTALCRLQYLAVPPEGLSAAVAPCRSVTFQLQVRSVPGRLWTRGTGTVWVVCRHECCAYVSACQMCHLVLLQSLL